MARRIVKTKVLFGGLKSTTDEEVLREYLTTCGYNVKQSGIKMTLKNNGNEARVNFISENDVNKLMNKRPHRIEGKEVEIYRSIPLQEPFIIKKGSTTLIISEIKRTLTKLHLQQYFERYGKIKNIGNIESNQTCQIEFEE